MEIVVAWFWVIKLIFASITIYVCWVAFMKNKFSNKFWNIIAFGLILFAIIMPVKIGVNTSQMQNNQNYAIEQVQKDVPETVKDNSFKESVKSVKSIDEGTLK